MYNRKVKNNLRAHACIRRKYEQQTAKTPATGVCRNSCNRACKRYDILDCGYCNSRRGEIAG